MVHSKSLLTLVLTTTLLVVVIGQETAKLAIANNQFGLKLFSELSKDTSKNVFISPFSISTALGMLYYGARGETREELCCALGYGEAGVTDDQVAKSYKELLTKLAGGNSSQYVFSSANSILVAKSFPILPNYIDQIQRYYDADASNVDFVGNKTGVVSGINKWVSEKTNGKIDKLLDDLDPSTVMFLLNAVYFKGVWKTQFPKGATKPMKFNNYDSSFTQVPTMNVKDSFPHAPWRDCQVLELPYKGEDFSMLVFLPDKGKTLEDVRSNLTAESLQAIMASMAKKKVQVALPKFKISYKKELSDVMKGLGASLPFSRNADFSGISEANLRVSGVIHKARVEVNEEGSVAAAVTAIRGKTKSKPRPETIVPFVVDRPFLFAIVSRSCGPRCSMLMFMGSVLRL